MPNSTMPSRKTSRSGRTRANSTADWPCSDLTSARVRIFLSSDRPDRGRDRPELAADREREQTERGERTDDDDDQHDAVLGHRLTVLALDEFDQGVCLHLVCSCGRKVSPP